MKLRGFPRESQCVFFPFEAGGVATDARVLLSTMNGVAGEVAVFVSQVIGLTTGVAWLTCGMRDLTTGTVVLV